VKVHLIKLGAAAFVVVSIAVGQPLPSPQQYSTQTAQSVGGVAVAGGMGRLAILTGMLALTANQQEQAKAIFDEEEAVLKPLVEQLEQASDTLASAEKAAAPDAEIDQLARNMASISGEILAVDAKAQSKIYSQLTAEQKQKVEQLPHPFFAPSAPLLPPGPVFISTSGGHLQNRAVRVLGRK
jgi:Spy/CpxP family protein refolding chaperone